MQIYIIYKIMIVAFPFLYALIFGILATVPLKNKNREEKCVSVLMLICPIITVLLVILFARYTFGFWFWEDEYTMKYFQWILLGAIGVGLLINAALGEYISVITEDGIYARKFVGRYKLYSYENIKEYAKILSPFCYKNYLYIYYGDRHLAIEVATSLGGRRFLEILCEKLSVDYEELRKQIGNVNPESFNFYVLMQKLEKQS